MINYRGDNWNFHVNGLVIWVVRHFLQEILIVHALRLEPDTACVIEYLSHLELNLDGSCDHLSLSRIEVDISDDEGAVLVLINLVSG